MQYGAIWCIVQCQVVSPDPRMSVGPSFRHHQTGKGGEGARAERNMAVGFKAIELVSFHLEMWFLHILHQLGQFLVQFEKLFLHKHQTTQVLVLSIVGLVRLGGKDWSPIFLGSVNTTFLAYGGAVASSLVTPCLLVAR